MIDHTQAARAERGLAWLRVVLAALLLAHGVVRFWHAGVAPFGEWLEGQGIPFGIGVAWFITSWEMTATWLIAFGPKRWLPPLCAVFIAIYGCGIWLVHAPAGWFVVGAGRNGAEYSALLIACLLLLAWVYWPLFRRRRRATL